MAEISQEERDEFMELLKSIKQENTLIIVEGINDRKALEHFGLRNIKTLSRKPHYAVIESIVKSHHKKEVIILTDLDPEGRKLYRKLHRDLTERGVTIDNKLRHFLFRKTQLSHIEGLKRYLDG